MILAQLFVTFLKIGLFTIGSGYSMLVLAQRYVVETRGWLTVDEFTDIVAIAEVTPGPIMINLATFVGTKTAGFKGALSATAGLVFIPFVSIFLISVHYEKFRDCAITRSLFKVLKPMVIGFITVAVIKLSQHSINDLKSVLIAVAVIIATYFLKINPVYTIACGIVLGLMMP